MSCFQAMPFGCWHQVALAHAYANHEHASLLLTCYLSFPTLACMCCMGISQQEVSCHSSSLHFPQSLKLNTMHDSSLASIEHATKVQGECPCPSFDGDTFASACRLERTLSTGSARRRWGCMPRSSAAPARQPPWTAWSAGAFNHLCTNFYIPNLCKCILRCLARDTVSIMARECC